MHISTCLLVLVSLVYLVSAANIYKRADDKTIMVDDTSANTKHKSTLADNIAKLVNSALEKEKAEALPKVHGSPNKPEPHQPAKDIEQLNSHERKAFFRELQVVQRELKALNNLSGRIAKDQQKLSTQFEAYKKLVATFEKSLAFFESLGKQVEDKKED